MARPPKDDDARSRVKASTTVTVFLLVAAAAFVQVANSSGSDGAQSHAAVTSARAITLAGGDRIAVRGTNIHCLVTEPPASHIVCWIGSTTKPAPGSYGFLVSDLYAAFLRAFRSGPQKRLWASPWSQLEPKLSGAGFPPTTRAPRALTAKPDTALEVSGTHVLCLVIRDGEKLPEVACGLHTPHFDVFAYPAYLGVITPRFAAVQEKRSQDSLTTVIRRLQP